MARGCEPGQVRKEAAVASESGAGVGQAGAVAYAPVRPLDSLYVRGGIEIVSLMSSRLAIARQASDHLPLVADLTLL